MSTDDISNEYEYPFKWTIRDFLALEHDTEKDLRSPFFSTDDGNKWRFRLRPYSVSDANYVSLYLQYVAGYDDYVEATYTFAIMNADGKFSNPMIPQVNKFTLFDEPICAFENFIARDILLENKSYLLPDGQFTVVCQIIVLPKNCKNYSKMNNLNKILAENNNCINRLIKDMENLYNDEELSDIQFSARGKEFKAHKLILCSRSPVFRKLLQEDNSRSFINIDVDPRVFTELLQFIYTGRVDNIQEISKELLIEAHKYQLNELEDLCVEFVANELDYDNAVEISVFAKREQLDKLKAKTFEFISNHFVKKDSKFIIQKLINVIDSINFLNKESK